jgi:hypothetical protein
MALTGYWLCASSSMRLLGLTGTISELSSQLMRPVDSTVIEPYTADLQGATMDPKSVNYRRQLPQRVLWHRVEPVREWLAWIAAATVTGTIPIPRD